MNEILIPIVIKCMSCGEDQVVEVYTSELNARMSGAKIQDAFPRLSPADRDLFLSFPVCGKCHDEMAKAYENEEEEEKEDDDPLDLEAFAKENNMQIVTINVGDRVFCDLCNKEYSKADGIKGGMLFNRSAVCPDCEPVMRNSARMYNEEMYCIDPNDEESFYEFVIRMR